MNKKIWVLVAAICLLLPVSLSAEVLDFSIGATAQYNLDFEGASSSTSEDFFDFDNYSFGAEARLKFLLLEVSDMALVGTENDGWQVTNLMTAGLSFDLLNLIRVGVGLGPEFLINIDENGNLTNENDEEFNFGDMFMQSNCTYKANVDFLLGGITLSANYTIPSQGFNIQNIIDNGWDFGYLAFEDPNEGKLGVSVLISLI